MDGVNYLTVGGGAAVGTYYYSTHGSYPVVVSAAMTIDANCLDKVRITYLYTDASDIYFYYL